MVIIFSSVCGLQKRRLLDRSLLALVGRPGLVTVVGRLGLADRRWATGLWPTSAMVDRPLCKKSLINITGSQNIVEIASTFH